VLKERYVLGCDAVEKGLSSPEIVGLLMPRNSLFGSLLGLEDGGSIFLLNITLSTSFGPVPVYSVRSWTLKTEAVYSS
jgi:hypothetical protein